MNQLMTLAKFRIRFESKNTGKNDEHQESVVDDPTNDKEEREDPLSNYRSAMLTISKWDFPCSKGGNS